MFRLNLKIALRNLWKNKGNTFINITGLSIGMASCILIFIFISYQLSYDQHFKNKDRIYRVNSYWKYTEGEEFSKGVPQPLVPAMRMDFAMLEQVAAIQSTGGVIKIKDTAGKIRLKTSEQTFYVEPEYFKIFDHQWLQGDPAKDLVAPNTVALSEKMAAKLFGDWHRAIGQTIGYSDKPDLKVTAVFADLPENSSNRIDIAISYSSYQSRNLKNWGGVSDSSEAYILLKEGTDISSLAGPKDAFHNKYFKDEGVGKSDLIFQPLTDIHKNGKYGNFAHKTTSMSEIYGLVVIGVFLMLTACINFINLATAQAVSRSKEVGVRKVMGSRRKELIVQFLTETITLTFLALLLACALTEAALPSLAGLFKEKLSFSLFEHPVIFLFMTMLVLVVGFLAGLYPALVMSGFSPALAIKNKVNISNTGGGTLRKVLVIVQFAITIILITGTLVIITQMKYMREKPLGFNSSAIALPYIPTDSISKVKYDILKSRISKIPGVISVSLCSTSPSSRDNTNSNFSYGGKGKKDEDFSVNYKTGDEDYIKTFGLQLIAGRNLSKTDTLKDMLVNETILRKLNVGNPEEAIGKQIRVGGNNTGTVVGVVKDFNNMTLRDAISPIVIFSSKRNYEMTAIKMDSHQIPEVMKNVELIWNSYFPENVYESTFMDDEIEKYYRSEQVMGTLFKVFASVIIFISFIGLFGLISFVAAQRTKEMAIRKVLGATTLELVKMLNTSFVVMVLIANLAGWPIAYIFISKWLERYTYRIELSIWPFAAAMGISVVITLLTVSLRSYKAAKTNPVDALKYE
jgi:putative ABC transport system permease protein